MRLARDRLMRRPGLGRPAGPAGIAGRHEPGKPLLPGSAPVL